MRSDVRGTLPFELLASGSEKVQRVGLVQQEQKTETKDRSSAWVRAGSPFSMTIVVQFFSPHAKEKSAIFLSAIGEPLKRKAD